MKPTYAIGLDLGQLRDPSAIAVARILERRTGRTIHVGSAHPPFHCETCRPETEDYFEVTDVGRLALGTSYPDVARHVREVVRSLNDLMITPYLAADATGVGRPVINIFSEVLADSDVILSAVSITSGEGLRGFMGRPEISVAKSFLVSRLQALLQTGRVRLPETREARALARELADFEIRASAQGVQAGAFRTGSHDDLVIALGLACLFDPSEHEVREIPVWW